MSDSATPLLGACQDGEVRLCVANRHGLIVGATGKTVTLQVLAEGFACAVLGSLLGGGRRRQETV